jgi:hypothetical protein
MIDEGGVKIFLVYWKIDRTPKTVICLGLKHVFLPKELIKELKIKWHPNYRIWYKFAESELTYQQEVEQIAQRIRQAGIKVEVEEKK